MHKNDNEKIQGSISYTYIVYIGLSFLNRLNRKKSSELVELNFLLLKTKIQTQLRTFQGMPENLI